MMQSLPRKRIPQIIAAAAVGAIIGFLVYTISRVTGRNLDIILGAIAGAVAVVVIQLFWRTTQLTQVKITVPHLSELTFVVNDDARLVAWKLYVETVTRVSTQALADEDGFIREALTSLYGLFATTRDMLKASRPSAPVSGQQTVEYLAVTMLNLQLRPFLSKWHPRLREFEKANLNVPESAWPENASCRAELRQTQTDLAIYAKNFARLAGVHDAEEMMRQAIAPTA
jgi:hypothetical protein